MLTEINPDVQSGARVVHNAHDESCGGTFTQAFANSCNTVFAPLGVKVGAKRLVDDLREVRLEPADESLQRLSDRRRGARAHDDADRLQR